MPENNYPTLLKLLQGKAPTLEQRVVESVIFDTPFLEKLPARVISGTSYKQLVRTSLPLIQSTPYNTGVPLADVNYVTKNAECYPYKGRVAIDKMLVDGEPELAKKYTADLMNAHIRGAFASLEMGLFYGKGKDSRGTLGLVDTIGDYMTISATGSNSARTHGGASVWAVCLKEDMIHVVWGNSSTVQFGARTLQDVSQPTADGKPGYMTAYCWNFGFHAGLSQMDEFATSRIVNESDENPLTDSLLADLVNNFPAGHNPDIIVMSRGSRARLQKSRSQSLTYVKKNGSSVYADTPTDYEGIPIICSDALMADETEENIAALRGLTELRPQYNTANLIR